MNSDNSIPQNFQASSPQFMCKCRICFDEADYTSFVSPCKCIGSDAFVHPDCLNTWINTVTDRNARYVKENTRWNIWSWTNLLELLGVLELFNDVGERIQITVDLAKAQLMLLKVIVRIQLLMFQMLFRLLSPILQLGFMIGVLLNSGCRLPIMYAYVLTVAITAYLLWRLCQQWFRENTVVKWRCNVRNPSVKLDYTYS
uniref:RING-CH-type domain-containing protein n=1 Tax=Ditylenchus dipsaci TaxID=166011 RepID=A0A915CS88_9BILA